jgi:hypothetical protein
MRIKMNDQIIRATKEFQAADKLASGASRSAHKANSVLETYKSQSERLKNWKSIMSTAPVVAFTVIFIVVSIGEYLVSKEIYREFNEKWPWAIAIVFFVAGLFVSEFLVYKLFGQKRSWKRYELKRDENNNSKTNDEIDLSIKKITTNFFIFGLVLGLLIIAAIGFLSYKRVQGELAAGMRETGFGIMDFMPVILYIIEIISGAFIWYLIKQLGLGFTVKKLWKRFSSFVLSCYRDTAASIKKYQDAEQENYDPFQVQLSDNIHTAFYRNNSFTLDNKEKYISTPKKMNDYFNLNLIDKDGQPLRRHITIISDYKFTASGSTNADGKLTLEIEGTFPGDSCKRIFIRQSADTEEFIAISEEYDLDVKKVHDVIIG